MTLLSARSTVLALGLLSALPSAAAVYRVGDGAGCTHATIQDAVNTAVINGGADTIQISQNATYTDQAVIIENPNGAVDLAGGYTTCNASAPTPGAKTLVSGDGGATDAVFSLRGHGIVSFTALDIQQGDQDSGNGGGGIEVRDGPHNSIRLVDTWVRNNRAGRGGGISLDNTFSNNPSDTLLELVGDSRVISNNTTTSVGGGGIYCRFATVRVYDTGHIGQNSTTGGSGGGIRADNCPVLLASRGLDGAVLSSNTALYGGGIALFGAYSVADIITVDPAVPTRIVNNQAGYVGGAIFIYDDAHARVYDGVLADNTVHPGGAAVAVYDIGIGTPASFLMQGSTDGAPIGAVNCAQPEACNRITGNRSTAHDIFDSGATVLLVANAPLAAFATFRGTRFNDNTGRSLVHIGGQYGQVWLDGVLIDGNTITGSSFQNALLNAAGSNKSLVVTASTIADNTIGNNLPVMRGPGFCDITNNYDGSHIYRSIIWQPGSPVFSASSGTPSVDCFQYVLAHNLDTVPRSMLNRIGDPQFIDAAQDNYRPRYGSPALDYAPGQAANFTRDRGTRVVDLIGVANRFGPQDLGAYEIAVDDHIFYDGFQ